MNDADETSSVSGVDSRLNCSAVCKTEPPLEFKNELSICQLEDSADSLNEDESQAIELPPEAAPAARETERATSEMVRRKMSPVKEQEDELNCFGSTVRDDFEEEVRP